MVDGQRTIIGRKTAKHMKNTCINFKILKNGSDPSQKIKKWTELNPNTEIRILLKRKIVGIDFHDFIVSVYIFQWPLFKL